METSIGEWFRTREQELLFFILMRKCVMCDGPASLQIKGTNDCYCAECARDAFGDTNVLVSIEEQARALKDLLEGREEGGEPEREEPKKEGPDPDRNI